MADVILGRTGNLLAGAMTSCGYRVTLPFDHMVHGRWKRNRRIAVATAGVGLGAIVAGARSEDSTAIWVWIGLALLAASLLGGTANAVTNNVGFRATRDDRLVLTGAHPAFAAAVRAASVEPLD